MSYTIRVVANSRQARLAVTSGTWAASNCEICHAERYLYRVSVSPPRAEHDVFRHLHMPAFRVSHGHCGTSYEGSLPRADTFSIASYCMRQSAEYSQSRYSGKYGPPSV